MSTPTGDSNLKNAFYYKREITKIKKIENLEDRNEVLQAKENVLTFRAECVSRGHSVAVSVCDQMLRRLSGLLMEYDRSG